MYVNTSDESQYINSQSFCPLVSQLSGLVTVRMHGWLLDAEDCKMFDAVKVHNPI